LSLVPDELLLIHGCQNPQRAGDVVFVHGLNGDAHHYWCYESKPENYWPAWVGEDLPNVGVWSLGYETAAFKTRKLSFLRRSGYRGFAMPLWDRAKSVALQLEVKQLGERPLVFVTHSMGGLLVKQLLRSAKENSDQKPWKNILKSTRGVCFIATPHIGADLAKWASYFGTLLGTNISIKELQPHESTLRQLNEFYLNHVTRKGVNIQTLSFYETKPLFNSILVVAEGDANPGIPGAGLYALGKDHISICKPRSKSDPLHMKLVDFIRTDCFQLTVPVPSHPKSTAGTSAQGSPAGQAAPSPPQGQVVIDRTRLVETLERLAPADFASVVTRILGAAAHISRHGTIPEHVAELVHWAEGPTGPGLIALENALQNFGGARRA
jgi:hypothetical protein